MSYFCVLVVVKYFVVYSGLEVDCYKEDVKVLFCDLVDIYLLVFYVVVIEGWVELVMCVYNVVDGVFVCVNE